MSEQSQSPTPAKPIQVQYLFLDALREVMNGRRITKLEWDTRAVFGLLKDGVLMIHKEDDKYYHWIISDGDLFGDDWVVLPDSN